MAKFTKLNIGDTVASSGGRVLKKLSAESEESADIVWDISTQSSNVTASYNEATATLSISGTGNMQSWTTREDVPWVDYRSVIAEVKIGDGITNVGYYAFYNCTNLTKVTLPNSLLTIEDRAFYKCNKLASITIPDGVTKIGNNAFWYCTALTSITIPSTATVYSSAFEDCTSLFAVTMQGGSMLNGMSQFKNCTSIEVVTLSSTMDFISSSMFMGCSKLGSITIPASVTSIGNYAFSGCPLTSAKFETTSGWKINGGDKLTASNIGNTATAATYLTTTYVESNLIRV